MIENELDLESDNDLEDRLRINHTDQGELIVELLERTKGDRTFIEFQIKSLSVALEEFKNETHLNLADKELRLLSIEKLRDTTNYPQLAIDEKKDHELIQTLQVTWKFYFITIMAIGSIIGGIIGFLLKTAIDAKVLFHG